MIEFEPIVTTVYQTSDGKMFYSEEEVVEYVDGQNKNNELDRLKYLISDEIDSFSDTLDDETIYKWNLTDRGQCLQTVDSFSEHIAKKFISDPTWLRRK